MNIDGDKYNFDLIVNSASVDEIFPGSGLPKHVIGRTRGTSSCQWNTHYLRMYIFVTTLAKRNSQELLSIRNSHN